jgi:hypothetical protein
MKSLEAAKGRREGSTKKGRKEGHEEANIPFEGRMYCTEEGDDETNHQNEGGRGGDIDELGQWEADEQS